MTSKQQSPRRRANGGEGSEKVQLGGEPRKYSRPRGRHQTVAGRAVHRPDGLAVLVQLQELDGEMTVDVRLHRRGPSGISPTSRGFRLATDRAHELATALLDVIAADATGPDHAPD